jgi:hypothetical protein
MTSEKIRPHHLERKAILYVRLATRMEDAFEFAFTCHPRRDLALRYANSSAPAPVAPTAQPKRQERTQNWIKLGGNVSGIQPFRPDRSRACSQLSQMMAAAKWIAARKFLAVLT